MHHGSGGDQLLILDDCLILTQLRESLTDSYYSRRANPYGATSFDVISRVDLGTLTKFTDLHNILQDAASANFLNICLSDRCITLDGTVYDYQNGNQWKVNEFEAGDKNCFSGLQTKPCGSLLATLFEYELQEQMIKEDGNYVRRRVGLMINRSPNNRESEVFRGNGTDVIMAEFVS